MIRLPSASPGPDWHDVMACHLPPGYIARLDSVRVGIAGAGGLGSNCAMLLVRSVSAICISRITTSYHSPI